MLTRSETRSKRKRLTRADRREKTLEAMAARNAPHSVKQRRRCATNTTPLSRGKTKPAGSGGDAMARLIEDIQARALREARRQITTLEKRNAKLEFDWRDLAVVRRKNTALVRENGRLKHQITKLKAAMRRKENAK